jgi:hypothetical protein
MIRVDNIWAEEVCPMIEGNSSSHIWHGFGRIAEKYGFTVAALVAHQRVTMPEEKYHLLDFAHTLGLRPHEPKPFA